MQMLRFAVRTIAALSLLGGASCSLALATDSVQCEKDADCDARGGELAGAVCQANVCVKKAAGECESDADCKALGAGHEDDVCVDKACTKPEDPKWGCIGKVEPLPPGKMYTLTVRLLDLITNQPAMGLTIKHCNKYDAPCATPIGMPQMDPTTGGVTVTVPSDVESYLDLQGGDYYPTIAVFDHLAESKNDVVLVVPKAAAASLAQTAGVTIDDTKGLLLVRTTDCTLAPTGGASVTIFPSTDATGFYTVNSTTNPNATQTDASGNAGYVNVEPGSVTITGTVGPMGQEFGKASALMRAGTITAQILRPTPTL